MENIKPENLICKEIIACDPGIGGGIAKWSDKIEVWKMPASLDDLCDFFDYQKTICKNPLVILEKVQLWQGDDKNKAGESSGRQFRIQKMLEQYASLSAAIKTRGFQLIEVAPISWMSYLSLRQKNEDRVIRKRRFKDIAQELYPSVKVNLNVADALLIVEYGRRIIKYSPLLAIKNIQKPREKSLF